MKVLMKKMKKYQITRSFAWVWKKETEYINIKNNYFINVVYSELWFSVF